MAYNARQTEHAGSKKGRGAFYGRKVDAKAQSNRRRRENDKAEARVDRARTSSSRAASDKHSLQLTVDFRSARYARFDLVRPQLNFGVSAQASLSREVARHRYPATGFAHDIARLSGR
jgi:hypothetical protein